MRTALLGCKWTTLDLLHGLASSGVDIDTVITLSRAAAERAKVAGFEGERVADAASTFGQNVHVADDYTLRSAAEEAYFRVAGIDVLLVIGWERLIPAEILQLLGVMACGMHGSSYGLPRGRGRSPLNWSLITGRTRFATSLFRYNDAVDAGAVIGTRVFEINQFDTVQSLHLKNRIAMQQLVERHLPEIAAGHIAATPQPAEEPSYYPARRPEDSLIDWRSSTTEIYNLVRAVAPPYPAAFCFAAGSRLEIRSAYPFDGDLFPSSIPAGTVVDVSRSTSSLVIKTSDGSLHVRDWAMERPELITAGMQLTGGDAAEIHRRIVERYPATVPEHQREVR